MQVHVSNSHYKDQNAVKIENEHLSFKFLPSMGSKLASAVDKKSGREFLVQRANESYLIQPYDGIYVNGECSGFDDMFPAIDSYYYQKYPWEGVKIPDHGEVWSLPWNFDIGEDKISMSVHGVRFPYKLTKEISFKDENTLRIKYGLTNLSDFDIDFLWAAHIMANVEENSRIYVPQGLNRVVCTITNSGRVGKYGDEFSWPRFMAKDGRHYNADIVRSKEVRNVEKYYFKDKLHQGWCAVTYPTDDTAIMVSFPHEKIQYLGIMNNEGGWDDLYNVILEPCTAPFDRADIAELHEAVSILKGKSDIDWYLDITIDKVYNLTELWEKK